MLVISARHVWCQLEPSSVSKLSAGGCEVGCESFPRRSRLLPIHTHVLSTLLFNVATWPQLTPKELAALSRPYAKALKVAAHCRAVVGHNESDHSVRVDLGMPTLDALIRQRRLAHLRRVALHSPDVLRALLQGVSGDPTLFPRVVAGDVAWMCGLLEMPAEPGVSLDFPACLEWASSMSRRAWANLVAKAVRASLDLDAWRLKHEVADPMDPPVPSHVCLMCSRVFGSIGALASHQNRVHALKNQLRLHVHGSSCLCCLWEFHTRERMLYHLKSSPGCAAYALALAPLSAESALALDFQSRAEQRGNLRAGLQPRQARVPAFRLLGPRPFV